MRSRTKLGGRHSKRWRKKKRVWPPERRRSVEERGIWRDGIKLDAVADWHLRGISQPLPIQTSYQEWEFLITGLNTWQKRPREKKKEVIKRDPQIVIMANSSKFSE